MQCYSQTDVGRVRESNEDWVAWDPALRVALLADGMGGLHAGEVASREAVGAALEFLRHQPHIDAAAVSAAMKSANRQVVAMAAADEEHATMGTTLVVWAAGSSPDRCAIGHVGDSRAYVWRDRTLSLLTKDHSVVQQLLDEGVISAEEARVAPNRNVITRAVGIEPGLDCEVAEHDVRGGDWFVLCSDGLTDMLTEAEMSELLRGAVHPREVPDLMIMAANRRGGLDNISVVVIAP